MRQVNLLPANIQEAEKKRALMNSILITAGLSLLVLFFIHLLLVARVSKLQRLAQRPVTFQDTEETSLLRQQKEELNKHIEGFIQDNKVSLEVLMEQFSYANILKVIGDAAAGKVWLRAIDIDSQKGKCEIKGRTFNTRLVSEFMLELKKFSCFKTVNVSSMEKDKGEGTKELGFTVDLTLLNH